MNLVFRIKFSLGLMVVTIAFRDDFLFSFCFRGCILRENKLTGQTLLHVAFEEYRRNSPMGAYRQLLFISTSKEIHGSGFFVDSL